MLASGESTRELAASAPPGASWATRCAVTHEGARHLDDVLARRTRISIESWDRGVAAAPTVATLMAEPLHWDDEHKQREIEYYLARVKAERDSQTKPDNQTAEAARLGVPDITTSP
ncbi:MAG: glycerol-3-phosphate dehydrogenase C-terminal domain-containing protein [Streptosporangiaceae bacterium]